MQLRHARHLGCESHRAGGHVKLIHAVVRMVAEARERVGVQTELLPDRSQHGFNGGALEHIVSGRHRRMGGEHRRATNLCDSVRHAHSRVAEFTQALDEHEAGVTFVGVPHIRLDVERAQNAHTADAEQPFLAQPQVHAAGVESAEKFAILWAVFRQVRIEQQQRHAANHQSPGPHQHFMPRHFNRDSEVGAVGVENRRDRRGCQIERVVHVLLPAIDIDALVEVAVAIEQPDADQRQTQIGRRFAMVTGEHAESSGIDRHRRVQSELSAEIRDLRVLQLGI